MPEQPTNDLTFGIKTIAFKFIIAGIKSNARRKGNILTQLFIERQNKVLVEYGIANRLGLINSINNIRALHTAFVKLTLLNFRVRIITHTV